MSSHTEVRENRQFASEIKFLVEPGQADEIRSWARTRLDADSHGIGSTADLYHTTSLYFDTAAFDVFHRRGSFGRSKYRIRRYNNGAIAFLERKLKTRDLVSKRRSIVELGELRHLCNGEVAKDWHGAWFHRRLGVRELKPVCQISYLRTARVSMTAYGPIRLTLDEDLRAGTIDGLFFPDTEPGVPISKQHQILELKYRHALPGLFKQLVEEFHLTPQTVSKYRLAAAALGCVPSNGASRKSPEKIPA